MRVSLTLIFLAGCLQLLNAQQQFSFPYQTYQQPVARQDYQPFAQQTYQQSYIQPYQRQQNYQQPLVPKRYPLILSQTSNFDVGGSFNYGFQSEDGVQSVASGAQKALGPKQSGQVVSGSYAYTAPDGTPISASYYADETGFHIQGAHIPTPPPIPQENAKAILSRT